jgi:hypothetical protein
MRRMSFSATLAQMRDRSKTVTRRKATTWRGLKKGDELYAIEKGQGLAKGERQVIIALIRVVSNRVEQLDAITPEDVAKEGFPGMGRIEFIQLFERLNGGDDFQLVRRIEFEHVDGAA